MSGLRRLIRFGIVGIATSIVYVVTGTSLWAIAGLEKVTASTIAFLVAISLNYLAHKNWSFSSAVPRRYTSAKYLLTITTGMAINAIVIHLGTQVVHLNYVFIQLIAIAMVVSWNFIAFSMWVFRA